jgi:hypothetical protein
MATGAELSVWFCGERQRRLLKAGRYQVNGKEPAGRRREEKPGEKRSCCELRFADFGAGLG